MTAPNLVTLNALASPTRIAVIGGGAAGLAAAWHLSQAGAQVHLFESKQHLGGRLGSFFDHQSGQELDRGQHIALGCCSELLRFFDRLRLRDHWRRQREIYFAAPGGRVWRLKTFPLLPPPLHLLPSFVRLTFLSPGERLSVMRAMLRLRHASGDGTVQEWLVRHGQSPAAIRLFWGPLLISALSDGLDHASLAAARTVVLQGLLQCRHGHELYLPRISLRAFWDGAVGSRLTTAGVAISRDAPVKKLSRTGSGWSLQLADGTITTFHAVVVAVPWQECGRLFTSSGQPLSAEWQDDSRYPPQPGEILGLHLWFDRAGFTLPNAALLNTVAQWVFRPVPSANISALEPSGGHGHATATSQIGWYCQVVISAAHAVPLPPPHELPHVAAHELGTIFSQLAEARLIRYRLIRERQAVFCPRPEWEAHRPPQKTRLPGLAIAGDWTATGWPGTMEGAVRSGISAAQAILEDLRTPA